MKNYYKYLSDACEIIDKGNKKYKGATGRAFYVIGASSAHLLYFYKNIESKSNFVFKNNEEIILARTIIKLKNIKKKINITLDKPLLSFSEIKKIRLLKFIYYFGKNLLFSCFVSTKIKKVNCLFLWDNYKYINLFRLLLPRIKNSYLLLHNNNFFPRYFLKKTIKIPSLETLNIGCKDLFEYNYLILKKALLLYRPKVVVFAEGDSPSHSILSSLCKDLKIKSVCLQWGSAPRKSIKYGFRNFTCDQVLVHGNFFFNLIKKYTVKNIIKKTGNPLVDYNNKWAFKKRAIVLLQPELIQSMNSQNLNLFFYFISNVIKSNNDWKFVIRPHPSQNYCKVSNKFSKFSNCVLVDSKNISLKKSFTNCTVAFSIFSSSLTDGLSHQIIPFSFDTTGLLGTFQPDLNKLKIGISTDNIKDAILKANNLLRNKKLIIEYCKNIKKYKFNINYKYGKQAINEICKYIRN
jgi:hypothetical protein